MAVFLSPVGGAAVQFFDNSGQVLTGGLLYTYLAGTTTPIATYTNNTGITFHTNPIILDASGRVPNGGEIWLADVIRYKFVLKDSNNVLIGTYDNIVGINSNFLNYNVQEETQTATQGQTVFTLTSITYTPGTNTLNVYVNGSKQIPVINYVETDATTVTFVSGLNVGDVVDFTTAVSLSSGVTAANLVTFTGVKGQTGVVQDIANADGSDWIGFEATGTGAVAVDYSVQDKLRQTVSVKDFGALGDGTTNDTVAIAAAIAATPTNGTLYFPAGVYRANIFIWRSNISLIGAGSASTIIKLPDSCPSVTVPAEGGGTLTGLPNVLEIGNCALGNSSTPYTNVVVKSLTLDGNYTNNTAPTVDVFGHGCIITQTSYCIFSDVISQNCFVTCFDNVINANYNNIQITCINGGNAIVSGGHYPNFDINSSKYSHFDVISVNGYYGGRMLDNCYGNTLNISVNNASITGVVYNNQSVNSSYGNTIIANVINGCSGGQGLSVGPNCYNSTITANVSLVAGTGVLVGGGSSGNAPSGNKIFVTTYRCGGASVVDGEFSNYNSYFINSKSDGFGSSVGNYFAVDVSGLYNQFTISIQGGTPQVVRGIIFQAISNNNKLVSYTYDPNLVQQINNLGTNNYINFSAGVSPSVASANFITIAYSGSLINITGTAGISGISDPTGNQGRTITLVFGSALTVGSLPASGGNIKLSAATVFSAASGNTLTLISNGTYWLEISRALTQ